MIEQPRPNKKPWLITGLVLQVVAISFLSWAVYRDGREEEALGYVVGFSFRLAWHDVLHTQTGLVVLVLCCAIYALGAIYEAHPFVGNRAQLFIAVPVAAVISLLIFGVIALVIVGLGEAIANSNGDFWGFDLGGGPDSTTSRRTFNILIGLIFGIVVVIALLALFTSP